MDLEQNKQFASREKQGGGDYWILIYNKKKKKKNNWIIWEHAIVAVSTYETEKKERNEKWTNPPSPTCTCSAMLLQRLKFIWVVPLWKLCIPFLPRRIFK